MPQLQTLLMLLLLLFGYACSPKQSGVKLEISNNFVFGGSDTASIAAGGLMVWGRNSAGDAFGQALEDKDQINLQLNPGNWTFYAMSWDGTTAYDGTATSNIALGGKVRCAKSPITKLESNPVAVDLVLSNDNCQDVAFTGGVPTTGPVGNIALPSTIFNFCSHLGPNIDLPTKVCADTKADPNRAYGKGAVSSYRVTLRNFFGPTTDRRLLAGGVKGECVIMTGDAEGNPEAPALYGTSLSKIPNLPAGGPGHPFHMTVEMFPGSPYCEQPGIGQRGSITKEFRNGIKFNDNVNNKYFAYGVFHRQYVEASPAKICETRSGTYTDHPFAGGDGTVDRPYLICSVPQFYKINEMLDLNIDSVNDTMSASFKLQANLDFNPYSNGLGTSSPALFQCLELGSNFIPIGYDTATCAGAGNPLFWGTRKTFNGNFFGANFALKNLRLRAEDRTHLGVFADFRGTYLTELKLEKSEISGHSYVGALAGTLNGTSAVTDVNVWNISGNNLDIEARDDTSFSKVGSLFGSFSFSTMKNLKVFDSKVRGEASLVGGLAGMSTNSVLTEVSIEADIDANSSMNSKVDVGGVLGHASIVSLQYVKHEGGIYTNAEKVGGILGSAETGTSLQDFYSITHIMSYAGTDNNSIGGVIGYWNSSNSLGNGYTLSVVRSGCNSGSCTEGAVAGTKNVTPSQIGSIYTLTSAETLEGTSASSFTHEVEIGTLAGMRLPSNTPALSTGWNLLAGEYPRFVFEQHPCHLPGVSGSGTGDLLNPIRICHETQFNTISAADSTTNAGKRYKLLSNIRLKNTSIVNNQINFFNGHLNGDGRSLIGGNSMTSSGTSGYIKNLTGSLSNLKIHGMGGGSSAPSPTQPHGVLVVNNLGTISNIEAWTYPNWTRAGSGLVGTNASGATISRVSLDGIFKGFNEIAPLAVINDGEISRVKTNGELRCNGTCTDFAGFVLSNTGSISRSEIQGRLWVNSGTLSNVSMLTKTNSGAIEDVLISHHTEFNVNASTAASYFYETSSGTLNRVYNKGQLNSDSQSYSSTITNFPFHNGTPSGGGVDTDVLRIGGRSGKLLLSNSPISCTNNFTLNIPGWSSVVGANDINWETAYGGGNYTSATDADKKLIAHVKFNDGTQMTQRIVSYSGGDDFGIATTECTGPGEVELYYSNDIPVDNLGVTLNGVLLPQHASSISNYSSAWQSQIWDFQNTDDVDAMLAYYGFLLGVTTQPVTPAIWSLEEDGIRLFEND